MFVEYWNALLYINGICRVNELGLDYIILEYFIPRFKQKPVTYCIDSGRGLRFEEGER